MGGGQGEKRNITLKARLMNEIQATHQLLDFQRDTSEKPRRYFEIVKQTNGRLIFCIVNLIEFFQSHSNQRKKDLNKK